MADCKKNTEENGSFKMANQIMNILEQHRTVDVLAESPKCIPIMIFTSLFAGWSIARLEIRPQIRNRCSHKTRWKEGVAGNTKFIQGIYCRSWPAWILQWKEA